MVLNSDVSPPGNHSVRIITSSGGDATISYIIVDTPGELSSVYPQTVCLMCSFSRCSSVGSVSD